MLFIDNDLRLFAGNKLQFALWQRALYARAFYREQLHVCK
jgi:hypothetical protein